MTTTHISPATTGTRPTTRKWLKLSAALTDIVVDLADRDDLTVSCTPGAGSGAPGCFLPALARIEIDGSNLPVDAETCNPHRPGDRTRYPAVWGVLVHEAAHAHHSRWATGLKGGNTGHVQAAILLEESRIEAGQLRRRPADRRWLRSSARQIVMDGFDTATGKDMTAEQAAHIAALMLARRDAGVFKPYEVADLQDVIIGVLGKPVLAELRDIWTAAHAVADDDGKAMLDLGRRWCEAIGTDPDAPGDQQGLGSSQNQSQNQGQSQGRGPSPLEQAARAAADQITSDQEKANEPERAEAEKIAQAIADAKQAAKDAAKVFSIDAMAKVSPQGPTAITGTRTPTPAEQGAARTLARLLRNAAHRERAVTVTTSATPPGRLRMRGALAADAQRAAGKLPTAEPFVNTQRRHVPEPPLRVGVACDVSASMQSLAGPVASAAYILNKAVSHVTDATAATVIFGRKVRAVTAPGQNPTQVREFAAKDNSHEIGQAIQALNLAAGLDQPGAARLLVIVSDGKYRMYEREPAQAEVNRLIKSGCAVLWLALGEDSTPLTGAQLVTLTDPAHAAAAIGQAAVRALKAA